MILLQQLRDYYQEDSVFITAHAAERFRQRGIKQKDIRFAVENGEIIEQYPDDFPFPSCLIIGKTENGRIIHVCMSDEGASSRIITAYYPDPNKWEANFKERKEN